MKKIIVSLLISEVFYLALFSLVLVFVFADDFTKYELLSKVMFVVAYILTIVYIIFFFKIGYRRMNLYTLPISFVILPFLLYAFLAGVRHVVRIVACPGGWEIWAGVVAVCYSLPFFLITTIGLVIRWFMKRA